MNMPIADMANMVSYDPVKGTFSCAKTGRELGWNTGTGHRMLQMGGRRYYLHRLAYALVMGEWPAEEIDHINGDGTDNRWTNLRACSHAENMRNSPKRSHSRQPYKGVRRARNSDRWQARIRFEGREISLGFFPTAEQARDAYIDAAKRLHGEFARAA